MTEMISVTGILTAGFVFSFAITSVPPIVKSIETSYFPCATAVRSNVEDGEDSVLVSGVLNKHRDCTPVAITAQGYDAGNVLAPAQPLQFKNLEPYRERDEMISRPLGLQLYGPWSIQKPSEHPMIGVDVHHITPWGHEMRTRFLEINIESEGNADGSSPQLGD